MMKIRYILMTLAASLLFAACSTETIDTWESKNDCVWFSQQMVNFTFRDFPNAKTDGYGYAYLPLHAATDISNNDRSVNVSVSNAGDGKVKYELASPAIFHAGRLVDSVLVKVYYDDYFLNNSDTLTFTIGASSDFRTGIADSLSTRLVVSNGYSQPKWWNSYANRYFGYFTQLKAEVYLAVLGSFKDPTDGDDDWYGHSTYVRYLVSKLTKYVSDHAITYPADYPDASLRGKAPKFSRNSY